jgi:hypothetical protein
MLKYLLELFDFGRCILDSCILLFYNVWWVTWRMKQTSDGGSLGALLCAIKTFLLLLKSKMALK